MKKITAVFLSFITLQSVFACAPVMNDCHFKFKDDQNALQECLKEYTLQQEKFYQEQTETKYQDDVSKVLVFTSDQRIVTSPDYIRISQYNHGGGGDCSSPGVYYLKKNFYYGMLGALVFVFIALVSSLIMYRKKRARLE